MAIKKKYDPTGFFRLNPGEMIRVWKDVLWTDNSVPARGKGMWADLLFSASRGWFWAEPTTRKSEDKSSRRREREVGRHRRVHHANHLP
jgi:hypothetical protein